MYFPGKSTMQIQDKKLRQGEWWTMCSVEPGWWGLEEHGILNQRYILKRVQQENREKGKKKNPTQKVFGQYKNNTNPCQIALWKVYMVFCMILWRVPSKILQQMKNYLIKFIFNFNTSNS